MESIIVTCAMIVAVIAAVAISAGCMEKSGVEVDDVSRCEDTLIRSLNRSLWR